MNEYEDSKTIQGSADRVFAFVSDMNNLPKYLSTLHKATPQSGERIQVQGEANGHPYDSDGYFRVDKAKRRMEWGSDGERKYAGWMEVSEEGRGASQVTVHLSFTPRPDEQQKLSQHTGSPEATIQEGLQKALESLENLIEGKGGKVETPAAT